MLQEMNKVVVTKLDAATRQLDCAIGMFFKDADPVPVHTLAFAAYQIIHDINHSRGGPDLILDALGKQKDGKDLLAALRKQGNYLKHADHDPCPNCGIWFAPFVTEVVLHSALLGLCQLSQQFSVLQAAYVVFMQFNSECSLNSEWKKFAVATDNPLDTEKLSRLSKECFLCRFIDAFGGGSGDHLRSTCSV